MSDWTHAFALIAIALVVIEGVLLFCVAAFVGHLHDTIKEMDFEREMRGRLHSKPVKEVA